MRERGFSLVELVVVLGMVSVLAGIAVLNYSDYIRRSNKESQTRTIYQELMQARLCSLTERRGRVVKYSRGAFDVYSSTKADVAPKVHVALRYPIEWNNTPSFTIDDRGIVQDITAHSICIEDARDRSALDCVLVEQTQVTMGSRKTGGKCEKAGIEPR